MKLEKLFNVVVMGGAALGLAACSHEADGNSAVGMTSATSEDGGATDASPTPASGDAGDAGLACSNPASPTDPCGCPCCWAMNCLNTEPCCVGFCSGGNHGKGCCGG